MLPRKKRRHENTGLLIHQILLGKKLDAEMGGDREKKAKALKSKDRDRKEFHECLSPLLPLSYEDVFPRRSRKKEELSCSVQTAFMYAIHSFPFCVLLSLLLWLFTTWKIDNQSRLVPMKNENKI